MKSEFLVVRLSQVAELNPRAVNTLEDNDVVSFLSMSAVTVEGTTSEGEERRYSEVSRGYTAFEDGDLLVAKITPCFENGKIAQAKLSSKYGFGSTEFHVIRPNSERVDSRYLLHFLRQAHIRLEGAQKMTGSAGHRRVPVNFFSDLKICLPSLPEQKRLAAILDQAEAIRVNRQTAIKKLDSFVRADFSEFFGDPSKKPGRWPWKTVGDLLLSANYGTSEKAEDIGEFPVLRMGNITSAGELDLSSLKYMDVSEVEWGRYLVDRGDILFNRTNSPDLVGKTALFRESSKMAYAGYLIRLRVNSENDPEYVAAFLNSSYVKKILRSMCKSIVGMANINAKELQAIKIPQPPLELQREFARHVDMIEKLKAVHRSHLSKLETLFASLQHRAFRGEL
jgi:type I restriction enzyme S subunit